MRFYSLEKVNSERVCIKILHSMCEKEEWLYEDGKLFIKMSEYMIVIRSEDVLMVKAYILQGLLKVRTSAISLLFTRPFFYFLHAQRQFCVANVPLPFQVVLVEQKKVFHLLMQRM